MIAKQDYARALLELRNAVDTNSKDPEAHYYCALAAYHARDMQSALASVSKALAIDPKHAAARVLQAQVFAISPEASMVRAAEELAESIVSEAPDPAAFDSLALAEIRLGKLDEAEKHLKDALERFPTQASLLVNLATLKLHQKDFAGAELVIREAAAKSPQSAAPPLALGAIRLIRGDVAGAEQHFREALRREPTNPIALFNLMGVQYRTGRRNEAAETLRLLSETPGDAYRPLRAIHLFQQGDHQEAISEFKRLYTSHKDDRTALNHLVTAYAILGRFADAMGVLDAELKRNGSNLDALLLRARIHLHLGNLNEAEADLTPALSSQYQSAQAHYLQGALLGARGQTRRRRAELAETLRLDPRHSRARVELCQLLLSMKAIPEAWALITETPADQQSLYPIILQRNWIRIARGDHADVEKDVDVLLAKERVPDAVLQKATVAFSRKDYRAADALAGEVLREKPDDVRAMEVIYKARTAQNQVAKGVEALKILVGNARKSAQAQFFLGAVLKSVGDTDGARVGFETALRANPGFHRAAIELAILDIEQGRADQAPQRLADPAEKNNATALLLLADLNYKAGRLEEALAGYRKAVDIERDNISAINNLAFLMADLSRDLDGALQLAQQAKRLDPENPAIDDTLGWVQYQKGMFRPAVESFRRATAREATARRVYHLAMAEFRAGNRTKGLEAFERAYKLDPTLPEARTALAAAGGK